MKRTKWLLVVLASLLALVSASSAAAEAPTRKIVVFKAGVHSTVQQAAVRTVGGSFLKQIGLVNATVAELSPTAAAALAARGDVVRVEDDAVAYATAVADTKAKPAPTPTMSAQQTPWGITRIGAPTAWNTTVGTGVKVAIVDTGISTSHPDLVVAGGVNTINPLKGFNDDNGHGSHVAGIVAASNNSSGVVGVAPGASLYAVKVLNRNGSGYISDIIEGLDWSISNGMDVVNMSLGTNSDVQTFHDAVVRVYNAGITLVAAAGNDGPGANSVDYPGAYSEVIGVAAIDRNNAMASWSSAGPQVDLAAPGVSIYSTYKGSSYATLSGTSMASPHVTGVVALRLQLHHGESPAKVAAALKGSADFLTGIDSTRQGAGVVNAPKAVQVP